MTQKSDLPLTAFVQASTNRTFVLHPSTAANWAHQWPTERIGDILISESPGSADGSVFAYWLGDKNVYSPSVRKWIQQHLEDHDVVRIYFVQGLPDDVHSSLEGDLADLKAAAAAATHNDYKTDAIAWADAYLSNVGLMSYTDLVAAYSWKPISEAPKDRYILGRDEGLKRPFVMIWNVPGQEFLAAHGMGDEIPTEYMELPSV